MITSRGRANEYGTVVHGAPGASAWQRVHQGLDQSGGRGLSARGMLLLLGGIGLCVLCAVAASDGRVRLMFWLLAAVLVVCLWGACRAGRVRSARARSAFEAARSGDLSELPDDLATWARGALSEESIGEVLAELGPGYRVEHDVLIRDRRDGRVSANVDHLVRTPSGAQVVIDTKRWAGQVKLGGDGRLRSERDRDPEGPRGRALETLQWLCRQVRPRPDLVIIAIDGPGTVAGGRIYIRPNRSDRGACPVVVIHARRLLGELRAVDVAGRR